MSSPIDLVFPNRDLADCHRALLSLQSKTIEALTQSVLTRHLVTLQMKSYLQRLSLDVDRLRVIHIAGTKGKGSTSAFIERICREQGLRTGLYSSPHLVEMNERFRMDGQPITNEVFLHHFWSVWDGLIATKDEAGENPPIPSYFRFLTLVGFHLFVNSKIDVVVLEVGLGGKLDATNIITKPVVCGITSIGYDHQEILGFTLSAIAGEKAGIIKHGVPVYSVETQPLEVRQVFEQVAASESAPLEFVSPLDHSIRLGLDGAHQYENAGLATSLAKTFLAAYPGPKTDIDEMKAPGTPASFLDALGATQWPGRCQILSHPSEELSQRLEFRIDGAHTAESMRVACNWWRNMYEKDGIVHKPRRHVLLFNCGHQRDPIELMIPLVELVCRRSSSSSSSSSSGDVPPPTFLRLLSAPFDHDRPHLTGVPSFELVLRNYIMPQQRNTILPVASSSSEAQSHIHPMILAFLQERFSFPSSSSPSFDSSATDVLSSVARHFETIVAAHANSTNGDAALPTPNTWQQTLFAVWEFVYAALNERTPASSSSAAASPALTYTYARSVADAIGAIECLAREDEATPMAVFVTGSLYIVGNVLQQMKFRV